MNLQFIFLLIFNLLFFSSISIAQTDKFEHEFKYVRSQDPKGIQILMTGQYHEEELNEGIENLTWFALKNREDTNEHGYTKVNYYLEKTDLNIEKVKDVGLDKADEKTGWKVSVDGDISKTQNIIFLITGIEQHTDQLDIKASNINNIDLFIGKYNSFRIKGDHLDLNAFGNVKEGDKFYHNRRTSNYYITANKYNKVKKESDRQVLGGTAGFDSGGSDYYHLVWAGDLDLDGKIDLLMSMSRHYNVGNMTLFLSSMAKEGEILRMVTQLNTTGC